MTETSADSQDPTVHNVQHSDFTDCREPHPGERDPLFSGGIQPGSYSGRDFRNTVPRSISESSRLKVSKWGRQLRRTSSDQNYQPGSQRSDSTVSTAQTTFLVFPQSKTGTSPLLDVPAIRPSQSVLRRSSTNSFHEANVPTLTLPKDPVVSPQLPTPEQRPDDRSPLNPWRIQRAWPTSGSSHSAHIRDFKWYPVRSASDPSSIFQIRSKAPREKDLPLKPCMKQKSKSAATSPPLDPTLAPDPMDASKRRKAKSVDFELAYKKLSLPLVRASGEGTEVDNKHGIRRKASSDNGSRRLRISLKRMTSCPIPPAKGRPADSAVTRTDVHVVAVAPLLNRSGISTPTPPKTPTMQIVESKTGRYEVIWDGVAEEEDIRAARRASSASQSLQAVKSTGTKGLERVNSKLEEWSWQEGQPTGPFMPQIVVYPDMDSHVGLVRDATADEHVQIYAPPNTTRTSRAASNREDAPNLNEIRQEKRSPRSKMHMVAFDAAYPSYSGAGYGIGASRGVRRPPTSDRRLSNMPASDFKFRGHRDSVALARYRLLRAGIISPELDTRGSGITAVAEGSDDIDASVTGADDANYPESPASEPLPTIYDDEVTPPSTPRPKSAIQSLKASISTPVLAPHSSRRHHVRILG